ncbi:FAD-dependent monooxygenase [Streptosporangium sp. CA-135522]|uniref:FAD-dependent monooxygenase n=1 Tax=Streptosporangium sp. CA-135522 TaxID=3240072 RepID=UPI003D8A154A
MPTYHYRTTVLIIGGGLTGLSAALFLAWHGVPVLLAERHSGTLIHPRARTINPRTLEIYRQVGLEERILSVPSLPGGQIIVHGTSLAAPEERRSPMELPRESRLASPCSWAPIDQDQLEAILRVRAEELGAEVRFGTRLTGFEQDGAGVTATVRDLGSGLDRTVRADYMIAADGGPSPIRDELRIPRTGLGRLGHTVTLVFEAEVSAALRGRRVGLCHLRSPIPGTVLMPHDRADRWVISFPYDPARGESPATFTEQHSIELIRAALGLADAEVSIVPQLADGTKVLSYDIDALLAGTYRKDRIFLAGDAAHVMPPSGAYGSGTGIQDAHNLAWKLAAVTRGHADPALLDTYESERRPVADLTIRQATLKREVNMGLRSPEDAGLLSPSEAVIFGYGYPCGAVWDDSPSALPALSSPAELQGRPGTRAPHLPVRIDGRECSLLDLYGRGFVLLSGGETDAWTKAAVETASRRGLRIDAYRFGVDLDTPDGCEAYGISASGAVLVRPDGYVAWRAAGCPAEPRLTLDGALERLLWRSRSPR